MIIAKINVNNIDKERLYVGKKGTYLNCVFIETPNSEYSDYMICQEVSKEEREAGQQGAIIGNARILGKKVEAGQGNAEDIQTEGEVNTIDKGDLPF